MPSYAALLREVDARLDALCVAAGHQVRLECEPCAQLREQVCALADLLERVTPEMMQYIRPRITYDGNVAEQSDAIMATLRALAAGPQGEEGRVDG